MAEKIEIFLFDKHIADLYKEGDRIIMKQYDDGAFRASPLSVAHHIDTYDCTHLKHLERVPGFVSDSLPGNFGNEILKNYFESKNNGTPPTVIDKLLFIGDRGLGALSYQPQRNPSENDTDILALREMFEKAKALRDHNEYSTLHDTLLVAAHSFAGGARSKAVVSLNLKNKTVHLGHRNRVPDGYMPAIIKYDDTEVGGKDKSVYSKLEYIYYLLATKAGIPMSESHLLSAEDRHHFVTRRFDLDGQKRKHVHSLAGLLHLDYNIPMSTSYEELLLTGRKLNVPHESTKQMFAQMLFNYMFVNQDDHSRNFSFMTDESFKWVATPAYDITFAKGEKQTVEHQLSLYGKPLSAIGFTDITKLANEYAIDKVWMAETIEKMMELREETLPSLLKEYGIHQKKCQQLLHAVNSRNFGEVYHG